MRHTVLMSLFTVAAIVASAAEALAGQRLGLPVGRELGEVLPIAEGGLLGLVAAGVVGGVWLIRRKR